MNPHRTPMGPLPLGTSNPCRRHSEQTLRTHLYHLHKPTDQRIPRHQGFASAPGFYACAIALLFLAINLATIADYGLSFDEPSGMARGRSNLTLLQSILFNHPPTATDGGSDSFHPPLFATANYLTTEFVVPLLGWNRIAAGHILNLATASAGLVGLFLLGKSLFNATTGLIAELFMALFPRFVAHAHYNAKDIPVMVFGIWTLLALSTALQHGQRKHWILAALCLSAGITSKLDALFIPLIFLTPWFISRFRRRTNQHRSELRGIGLFLTLGVVFTLLFWPQLWSNPPHLFEAASHFAGPFNRFEITYLGASLPIDEVPWHYLPVHLLAVTPVPLLILVMIGSAQLFRKISHQRFAPWLLACWILFPLSARMVPGTLQYDGMRHVFLVVPSLALLAGLGFDRIRKLWGSRIRAPLYCIAFCATLVLWLIFQNIQIHPYQGSYLNEAVRFCLRPAALGDWFDFYSWGTPLKHAADWLNTQAPPNASVTVPNHLPTLNHYPMRQDLRLQESGDADFTLVMGWRKDLQNTLDQPPVSSLRCYEADLIAIHARTNTIPASAKRPPAR